MSELIQLEKRGHTAIITINNPPANTWTKASLKALEETIEALNADRNIFALVVTGQGEKFFSAGADLKAFADGDIGNASVMAQAFGQAFDALVRFRGVSIAAVNGYAMGVVWSAPWPAISALPRNTPKWPCQRPPLACCPVPVGRRTCPGWSAKAGPSG